MDEKYLTTFGKVFKSTLRNKNLSPYAKLLANWISVDWVEESRPETLTLTVRYLAGALFISQQSAMRGLVQLVNEGFLVQKGRSVYAPTPLLLEGRGGTSTTLHNDFINTPTSAPTEKIISII